MTRRKLGAMLAMVLSSALWSGCPGPPEEPMPTIDPVFPEDYRTSFTMVHDCRRSIEHDLSFVRIWANDTGVDVYRQREGELPDGTVLLKEEFRNPGCGDDPVGFTVMERRAGSAPTGGDWHWQDVRHDREVLADGRLFECTQCHNGCTPPEGFDWTCVHVEE